MDAFTLLKFQGITRSSIIWLGSNSYKTPAKQTMQVIWRLSSGKASWKSLQKFAVGRRALLHRVNITKGLILSVRSTLFRNENKSWNKTQRSIAKALFWKMRLHASSGMIVSLFLTLIVGHKESFLLSSFTWQLYKKIMIRNFVKSYWTMYFTGRLTSQVCDTLFVSL